MQLSNNHVDIKNQDAKKGAVRDCGLVVGARRGDLNILKTADLPGFKVSYCATILDILNLEEMYMSVCLSCDGLVTCPGYILPSTQ